MSQELIYGFHAVQAALNNSPENIQELLIQQGKSDKRIEQIKSLAARIGVSLNVCPRHSLDKKLPNVSHQGVVAVVKSSLQRYHESDLIKILDEITTPVFILVLDGIQDPHNLGACLRTADAAGCNLVIAPKDRAVGITSTVRKVACGAAESLPFIQVTNLARTLRLLKDRGIWLYGAAGEAKQTLYTTNFSDDCALILGAEEKGLRRLTRELCDHLIAIPMAGTVSSLNVSVATAVCLYEVVRQREVSK